MDRGSSISILYAKSSKEQFNLVISKYSNVGSFLGLKRRFFKSDVIVSVAVVSVVDFDAFTKVDVTWRDVFCPISPRPFSNE